MKADDFLDNHDKALYKAHSELLVFLTKFIKNLSKEEGYIFLSSLLAMTLADVLSYVNPDDKQIEDIGEETKILIMNRLKECRKK